MKKFIPYIAFAFLTGYTATSGLPIIAGGCSSHMNKTAENKCVEDDIECQIEKAEKLKFKDSVKSQFMAQIILLMIPAPRDFIKFMFIVTVGFTAGTLRLIQNQEID